MLEAKPTVFVSHSEKFKEQVAIPFRDHLISLGIKPILVSDMPLPSHAGSEPDAKIDYYLNSADMFVALLTPDDELQSGDFHARPNITDEISRARERPHLRRRIQIFKTPNVLIHSNINPTYEPLDVSDVSSIFSRFERQAIEWGILLPESADDHAQVVVGSVGPSANQNEVESNRRSRSAAEQMVQALDSFKASSTDSVITGKELPDPAARLHLAASTALALRRSASLYGIHELNGLYRERRELRLARSEVRHLLRTVIAYADMDNAPGWFWVRGLPSAELFALTIEFALKERDSLLQVQSLKLLAKTTRAMSRSQLKHLVTSALESRFPSVRAAGLDLFETLGDAQLLRELTNVISDDSGADQVKLTVRATHTPSAALKILLENPTYHTEKIETRLLANARKLPETALRNALASHYDKVRLLALRALDRSSRLRKRDVTKLFDDDRSIVKIEALKIGLRRGWRFDPSAISLILQESDLEFSQKSSLRIQFAQTQSVEYLRAKSTWLGGAGWDFYAALGLAYFETVADELRTELDACFSPMRTRSWNVVAKVVAKDVMDNTLDGVAQPELDGLIKERVNEFTEEYKDLDPFLTAQFIGAGMQVLAAHGSAADVQYARKFISSDDDKTVIQCVRLLAKYGDQSDVDALVDACKRLYGNGPNEAAKTALSVTNDIADTAQQLIASGKQDLMCIGIEALGALSLDKALDVLAPRLGDDNENVRAAAVDCLLPKLDRKGQAELIDLYRSTGDYYYYNVGTRIDRFLYAPGWFRGTLS